MNSKEQRQHKTVVDALRDDVNKLAETFDKVLQETTAALREDYRKEVGEERDHRLKLADEQRAYVDAENRLLSRRCDLLAEALFRHSAFIAAPWHVRWRWVIFGWLPITLR